MKNNRPIGIATRLNLLNDFIHSINKCETKRDIYGYLAAKLPNLIKADHASVSLLDNNYEDIQRYNLVGKEVSNEKNARPKGIKLQTNKTASGLALLKQSTYVTKHPNSNSSSEAAHADCAALGGHNYATGMSTPIYIKGQAIGTIDVASYTKNVYTKKTQKIFETIALLVSAALEKIHNNKEISSSQNRINIHAGRLKMLTNISVKLSQATSEEHILEIISDQFTQVLPNERLSYVVVDEENQVFKISRIHSKGKLQTVDITCSMKTSLLTSAFETGEPQLYNDFSDKKTTDMLELGVKYAWSIPIFENNKVTKLLNFGTKVEPQYKEDLLDIFVILSSLISATLENIKANEVISYRANYDLLTGAHNRHSFQEKMASLIDGKSSKPFTLLIVDLDGFKQLNDFHGHLFGDKVLSEVVKHFRVIFGDKSFIARLGGDEFAIIGNFTRYKSSMLNGMKLNTMKVEHDGRHIPVGFSAGIAHFPRHTENKSKLMKYADIALYQAKTSTSNIKVFKSSMAKQYNQKFKLLNDFKIALSKDEIIPFYQPIIDLKTQKLHALEALARWDHNKQGILSPTDFSEVFEVPEICGKIAYTMHRRICKDMAKWKRNGIEFNQVGLNVETVNLVDPAFPLHVINELQKHGLKPSEYAIELTENFILDSQNEFILENLSSLRRAGMAIVLDDFGTGFSSITHLKDLPITSVKLDKSYVTKTLSNEKDFHIVTTIISLAKKLNIKTVAEGIETQEAKKLFADLKCDFGQGILFAKPLPAHEIPAFIDKLNNKKGAVIAA